MEIEKCFPRNMVRCILILKVENGVLFSPVGEIIILDVKKFLLSI